MTDILAVFRSRAQAADCNSRLKAAGVGCAMINTPKEAGVGCGLFIKIPQQNANRAAFIIKNARYSAFYGFYSMNTGYGRVVLKRLN